MATKTAPARHRWVSVEALADQWGVSPWTVRRMIASGQVPARRVGRQLRIREDHGELLGQPVRVAGQGSASR